MAILVTGATGFIGIDVLRAAQARGALVVAPLDEAMAATARARATFGCDEATTIEAGTPVVVQWCRAYFGANA